MTAFAINPPSKYIVADDGRTVSSEWYRWFSRVQGVVGDDVVAQMQAAPVLTYSTTTAFANDKVLTAGAGMSFTSGAGTFTIALAASGVTAATYGAAATVPTFTVDIYGRLTLATDVPIAISAAAITSGTLAVGRGGTGLVSYTAGDLIYATGATTLAALAGAATGNALISGGVGVAPSWGKVGLTTHISGTLAVGNGGTGGTTFTVNKYIKGNGASPMAPGSITDDGTTVAIDTSVGFSIARTAVTSPAAGDGNVYSGTYTPTLTNTTNIDASTAFACTFFRIGALVTVYGRVDIDPTASGTNTVLSISLPVSSDLTTTQSLSGVASNYGIQQNGAMYADTTNDLAFLRFQSVSTSNSDWRFTFSYLVV